MLLQVALDLLDLDKAIKIALEVVDYVDYIEAGTPLIKRNGLHAVEELSKNIDKPIVADMKTMDTGYLEAKIAYEAGAYYTTVLAASGLYTIREAYRAKNDYKRGLMIDTIGLEDIRIFLDKLVDIKPDYIIIHSGIDMQHMGITPFKWLTQAEKYIGKYKFGVAGGIKLDNIDILKKYRFISLVIIGGGITRSISPRDSAKKLKEYLSTI